MFVLSSKRTSLLKLGDSTVEFWAMPHSDLVRPSGTSQITAYEMMIASLGHLLVDNWVSNLANAASLLWYHFKGNGGPQANVNWAGFYVLADSGELVLAPFQGKVACQTIRFGHGVCGTAAESKKSQVVDDVHAFPGHIACDGDTSSEIVVPILYNDKVYGVIDVDCTDKKAFSDVDVQYLEKMAELLARNLAEKL